MLYVESREQRAITSVYVKQSHKFRDFRTGCARSSELSGQIGILLAYEFNGAAHLCCVKAGSTSVPTGFTTPAVKHNACSKRSVCVSWACRYTERLFSRKQRARTSGLSTVVHESTASARYHIDFRAPATNVSSHAARVCAKSVFTAVFFEIFGAVKTKGTCTAGARCHARAAVQTKRVAGPT